MRNIGFVASIEYILRIIIDLTRPYSEYKFFSLIVRMKENMKMLMNIVES